MVPLFLAALANHVWQSTVVVVVAALVTLALKENQAKARYRIWWIASIKFLVPMSLFVAVGGQFRWSPSAKYPETYVSAVVFEQASQPFTSIPVFSATSVPAARNSRSRAEWAAVLVLAIWIGGLLTCLLKWWDKWRRARTVVNQSTLLTDGREVEMLRRVEKDIGAKKSIPIVSSTTVIEPSVFGVLRIVLVWPAALSHRLSDEELKAIILHELSHVRRHDNLSASFHMVTEALFWFHPMIWWLGNRLVEEREKACDEDVLKWERMPRVYAQGLLKVCEFCLQSPLRCASGVTGANLKGRVEEIMRNRVASRLSVGKIALLSITAVAILAGPVAMGVVKTTAGRSQVDLVRLGAVSSPKTTVVAPPEAAQEETPSQAVQGLSATPQERRAAFEVASVRPTGLVRGDGSRGDGGGGAHRTHRPANEPCGDGGPFFLQLDPRRFAANDMTLHALIAWAYGFDCYIWRGADVLIGGPEWTKHDGFDIQAIIPEGIPAYTREQFLTGKAPELQRMLQTLLAERFALVLRREKREMSVYELVSEKGPAKVIPWKEGDDPRGTAATPVGIAGRKKSMAHMASQLALVTGRPVMDRTGLQGDFNYSFSFSALPIAGMPALPPDALRTGGPTESVFAALERFGLKLTATKALVDVFVIDRAERVAEN